MPSPNPFPYRLPISLNNHLEYPLSPHSPYPDHRSIINLMHLYLSPLLFPITSCPYFPIISSICSSSISFISIPISLFTKYLLSSSSCSVEMQAFRFCSSYLFPSFLREGRQSMLSGCSGLRLPIILFSVLSRDGRICLDLRGEMCTTPYGLGFCLVLFIDHY